MLQVFKLLGLWLVALWRCWCFCHFNFVIVPRSVPFINSWSPKVSRILRLCVCVCVCGCACACACAAVRVRVRVRLYVCVCVCGCTCACACAAVRVRLCVRMRRLVTISNLVNTISFMRV